MHERLIKNNLKKRREELGLTQKQVACQIGVAESAYQLYEYDKRTPNARLAVKIAKALKTSVETLYGD